MPPTPPSAVDDARIVRLYRTGLSVYEVGREVHWSPTTVSRRLTANGVVLRGNRKGNPRLDSRIADETIALYDQGWSPIEIARKHGVTLSTMVERMEKLGLAKRPQTRCKRGHEFTEENTYIRKTGARVCRACNRLSTQKVRARQKEREHV
jgi:hypothetical protein